MNNVPSGFFFSVFALVFSFHLKTKKNQSKQIIAYLFFFFFLSVFDFLRDSMPALRFINSLYTTLPLLWFFKKKKKNSIFVVYKVVKHVLVKEYDILK